MQRLVRTTSSSRLPRFALLPNSYQTRSFASRAAHAKACVQDYLPADQEFVEVDGAGHSVYFEKDWVLIFMLMVFIFMLSVSLLPIDLHASFTLAARFFFLYP